MLVGSQG